MRVKHRITHQRTGTISDMGEELDKEHLDNVKPTKNQRLLKRLQMRKVSEGVIGKDVQSKLPSALSGRGRVERLRHRTMKAVNTVFVILLLFIFFGNAYIVYQFQTKGYTPAQSFSGLARNSLQVVDQVWEPKLRSTDGYTGMLIMGIDSRQLQFDGEAFAGQDRDIDSIMQVVVNNETGDVFMLSIPRDTGVTATEACVNQSQSYFKSINHLYKFAEDGDCPGGGPEIMKKYVTSVTGFENHYYAIISYDAFRDIVNAVGDVKDGKHGLYIDVPRNIQEYYPREEGGGFEAVYFPQGYQFIDSIQLLKYARSRKASSDFDRAKRQQQVIEALQQKVTSSETLSDPIKLYELYKSFQKNALFSEITLDDLRGAIALSNKVEEGRIYKLVLDDQIGGLNSLMTRPSYSGQGTHTRPGYYLSPVGYKDPECMAARDEYCKLKKYLQGVYQDPDVIAEESTIYAYSNVSGVKVSNDDFDAGKARMLKPISISKYALPAVPGGGDVQIFDFSGGSKPVTKKQLEEAFGVEVQPGSAAAFSSNINKEDFAIIVKVN